MEKKKKECRDVMFLKMIFFCCPEHELLKSIYCVKAMLFPQTSHFIECLAADKKVKYKPTFFHPHQQSKNVKMAICKMEVISMPLCLFQEHTISFLQVFLRALGRHPFSITFFSATGELYTGWDMALCHTANFSFTRAICRLFHFYFVFCCLPQYGDTGREHLVLCN